MESKDNSASADEQTSSLQFCQEVGSTNSNSIMENASSGSNGDTCPKCSICKKRLARKSKYTVYECIEVLYLLCF